MTYLRIKEYLILLESIPQLSGIIWSFSKLCFLFRFIKIDPAATTSQWADSDVSAAEAELLCNKKESHGYAAKKHTARLFVGTYLHTVCYGFHIMVASEGRKDLLKVLYEQMPGSIR